ncbi:DUF6462 family protein [Butyrivibrio sp. AE3009]|uniref:DUF6462 family protein n=1 Tax=Butyrivibrio sp. AE3009 TaxID=1280666 RepID=UPI001FA791C0|nr:DUF6462 family protein [Butyrivibrio sp. AE3009]
MNQANPPPIDLEKYLAGKKHRYCTYQNGARLYSMAYWSFVVMCKEAGANISLRKTALVDLDVLDKYIEENCNEDYESEDMDMTRRRKIENLEEIVKEGKKKYVRYAEGAELYSMGRHTFEALAKEAQATRKVKGVVLCNTEKIDAFIESFKE